MTEALFDLSEEYEAMLNQGIRLSGESMQFFLDGRLSLLRSRLEDLSRVSRILDFGCGLGYTSKRLHSMFPGAEVTGVDTSQRALETAREKNGGPGIRFLDARELHSVKGEYDLCYVNGVFHHIPPEDRPGVLQTIHRALREDGKLALFENNPWNFGARMVMSRIPFDRGAQMLSPSDARTLLKLSGFEVHRTDSLFFFPRFLEALRFLEPALGPTLLGAQYLVLAAAPGASSREA